MASLFVVGLVVAVMLIASRSATPAAPPPAASAELAPAPPPSPPFLEPWGKGLPRAGQWRNGFVVVDFDGDGQLDIVHGPARKSPTRVPQIFAGDGKGNFTLLTRYRFPMIAFDYGDVAVADFDKDGALDIALGSHLQGVAVLLRRGDDFETTGYDIGLLHDTSKEAKRPAPKNPVMKGFSSRAIEALDWNLDGRMDLIVSSDGPRPFEALHGKTKPQPSLAVLLGKEGGFEPVFPVTDLAAHGDSLAIAELDPAPGLEILAAANVVDSKHLLYRNTDSGLSLDELPGAPDKHAVRAVAVMPPGQDHTSVLLGGLAMGEHGLEGSLDLVALWRNGQPSSATRIFTGEPQRAITAVGVGDLEADGTPDVVYGDEQGVLRILTGDLALRNRGSVEPLSSLSGCAVYAIVLANLDATAGDEAVVSYAGDDGACASSGAIEVYRLAPQ